MDCRILAGVVVLVAASWSSAEAAVDPAQASYDTAFGLTRARSFDQAEQAWQNFLRQYPDHPLDGSAQYFLGETYFGRNDYPRAAAAFAAGFEKYPRSDLAAETLLKLGIALGRSGQAAPACEALARLEREFPSTSGVVRERALVEKRQYRCAEPAVATAPPATLIPPAARAPETAAKAAEPAPATASGTGLSLASLERRIAEREHLGSDGEPAPQAQPVTSVERRRLGDASDAEREAARAELYVTPPPIVAARLQKVRPSAPGVSGDSVKTAQILLAALDYDVGTPNGQLGPKTRDAVRAFETKDGMRTDGEVSDRLLQRLSLALAIRKAIVAPPTVHRVAGTGFVVSRSGYVLTALHLVEGCPDIRVRTLGSEGVTTPVVATDPEDDLALLRLKAPTKAAVTFHDGRGPRQGDGIVVSGLTLGEGETSDFYVTAGTIGAVAGPRNELGVMKISAAVATERGGAPVFDRAGRVIGVLGGAPGRKAAAAASAAKDGIALRATLARNFLDAHDVDYETGAATGELKAAEIGDIAKEVVVQIECRR
jgi:tol-pal system protein YbgF